MKFPVLRFTTFNVCNVPSCAFSIFVEIEDVWSVFMLIAPVLRKVVLMLFAVKDVV